MHREAGTDPDYIILMRNNLQSEKQVMQVLENTLFLEKGQ